MDPKSSDAVDTIMSTHALSQLRMCSLSKCPHVYVHCTLIMIIMLMEGVYTDVMVDKHSQTKPSTGKSLLSL